MQQADDVLRVLRARIAAIKEAKDRVRASDGKDSKAVAHLQLAIRPESARNAAGGSPLHKRHEPSSSVGERLAKGHVSLPGTPSDGPSPVHSDAEEDDDVFGESPAARRMSWGSDVGFSASRPGSKVDGSFLDALDSMPVSKTKIAGISYTVEQQAGEDGNLTVRADSDPAPAQMPRGMVRVQDPGADAGPLFRVSEQDWRELTRE